MNLLTGATGFVGGHVVEYLFQQGEISKATFRKGSHLKILDLNGVQCLEADLLDQSSLHEAVEGVDVILSMASPMPGVDSDFMRVNADGPANLLAAAREANVKTIVHLGTIDSYGFDARHVGPETSPRPSGDYQESKAIADRVFLDFAKTSRLPKIVVIRAARAVGSRDETLTLPLLRMLESGRAVLPRGSRMSFTHPKDIAQAMLKAGTNPSVPAGVYLVKSFDATPLELAQGFAAAVGRKAELRTEGLLSRSPLPQYSAHQLKASLSMGPQPSWGDLGYSPGYDMEETCKEIARWYEKEPWVTEKR